MISDCMTVIQTSWSVDATLIHHEITKRVEEAITKKWKTNRWRQLWFYFFEKEIRHDTHRDILSRMSYDENYLLDPEFQALLARSATGRLQNGKIRNHVTLMVNDYLFGQHQFATLQYDEADQLLAHQLIQAFVRDFGYSDSPVQTIVLSDVILQLRRLRADLHIASAILEGKHSYQSLLQASKDYIGSFAMLPEFLHYYGSQRSLDTITAAIDNPGLLQEFVQPHSTIVVNFVVSDDIAPYSHVDIKKTFYSTRFSKLGFWRASRAWYWKIGASLGIIVLTASVGASTLIVLPLMWGILAIARSQYHYNTILSGQLQAWKTHYTGQYTSYTQLYNTMVDPDEQSRSSIEAQGLMSRWFDSIPFSGHDLVWDVEQLAKQLYTMLINFSDTNECGSEFAFIDASIQWSQTHHLSLFVSKDCRYPEQALYRLYSLYRILYPRIIQDPHYTTLYDEQYQSIDELLVGKKYHFWLRTFREALWDGFVVAVSSGVLGRMGSYLWNWGITSSSVMAAGPGLLHEPLQRQLEESLLPDDQLIDSLGQVMSQADIDQFLSVVQTHPSRTLWDTMVDQFGFTHGNIYTNHLMDTWWRISDDQVSSRLFDLAFQHNNFPTGPQDMGWNNLVGFLHRTYDYDNLSDYSSLIDESWLSETLGRLSSGNMSISEFAQLSLEQREITTQALFWHLDPDALPQLFAHVDLSDQFNQIGSSSVGSLSGVENITGGIVETGSFVHGDETLSGGLEQAIIDQGQGLMDWIMQHTQSGGITQIGGSEGVIGSGEEGMGGSWYQGLMDWKDDVFLFWKDKFVAFKTWDFGAWRERIADSWSSRFAWPHGGLSGGIDQNLSGSLGDSESLGTIDLGVSGPVVSGAVDLPGTGGQAMEMSKGFWGSIWEWLKGTAPTHTGSVSVTPSELTGSDGANQILSGLDSQELTESIVHRTTQHSARIHAFTLPILKKDKKFE